MKYIIFFILLFSLIYLNYNIKESFSESTGGSRSESTVTESGEGGQKAKEPDKSFTSQSTTQFTTSTSKPTEDNPDGIYVNYNKYIILHNISTNDVKVPYVETGQQKCVSNSECNSNNNEICGDDFERCEKCKPDKCYKIYDKKMYDLDTDKESYMEVTAINNLDMSFKFSVIASQKNTNQMIVHSGLNLWYIYINDSGFFTLHRNNMVGADIEFDDILLTEIDDLYTFKIIVKKKNIKINIDGISKLYQFYDDDNDISIYDCD